MTTPWFDAIENLSRATVSVVGTEIPDGRYTFQRQIDVSVPWEDLRGGPATITNGGFIRDDSEPPFGSPIRYRTVGTLSDPADYYIQRNMVLSPSFNGGATTAVPGTGRTLTQVNDVDTARTVAQISANPAGVGIAGRTIAEFPMGQLTGGTLHQITGKVRYTSSEVERYIDLKEDYASYQVLLDTGKTYQDILAEGGPPIFAALFLSISNGATDYVKPTLVRALTPTDAEKWLSFSMQIMIPAGTPSTARIRLIHGTSVRELASVWKLDQFSAMKEIGPNYLYWFDGQTPTPVDPVQDKWPGTNFHAYPSNKPVTWNEVPAHYTWNSVGPGITWDSLSKPVGDLVGSDAKIKWDGTPYNSTSTYYGATTIFAEALALITGPDSESASAGVIACMPVHLNDPVSPRLGQWFGLIEVSDIDRSARLTRFSILHRSPEIAVNDVRGWESGKLRLLTMTLEERTMAIQLFSSGRILQFRNANPAVPEGYEGGPWYLSIADVTESRPYADARRPERYWELPYQRVERPKGLIDGASQQGLTWEQLRTARDSWLAVRSNYPSWMDILLDVPGLTIEGGSMNAHTGLLPTPDAYRAWEEQTLP